MIKSVVVFATVLALAILVVAAPATTVTSTSSAGSWSVDAGHSDAQLSTDGTTDFGKTKTTFTVGIARVNGTVKLDDSDPAKSGFDFRMYPASSMAPPIDEEGKVKLEWFTHYANMTLVCFHSKGARRAADGRLQTTGKLVLTRVDRNVELTPDESYAGPVYGPPMIHRLEHEATFVFDAPSAEGSESRISGTSILVREDFPQLLKAVIATYWPPVVQDKNCGHPVGAGSAYSGAVCTGTFVMTTAIPEGPHANEEDYPGPNNFNTTVGGRLTILVHMRLTPNATQGATGN